jgi:hypothetical protein
MARMMSTFSLLIVLGFLMAAAHSCDKAASIPPAPYAKETDETSDCANDKDCTAVNLHCCGCNQGGEQVAISMVAARAWKAKKAEECKETFCAQYISNHDSCKSVPKCIQGVCKLQKVEP